MLIQIRGSSKLGMTPMPPRLCPAIGQVNVPAAVPMETAESSPISAQTKMLPSFPVILHSRQAFEICEMSLARESVCDA